MHGEGREEPEGGEGQWVEGIGEEEGMYRKGVGSHSWGQGGEARQPLQAQKTRACAGSSAKDVLKELLGGKDLGSSHNAPHNSQQTIGSLLLILAAQEACIKDTTN